MCNSINDWKARTLAMLAGASALLMDSCSRSENKSAAPRGKGPPVQVTVAVATETNIPIELKAIGTVRPFATVSIKPRVDGQLGQIGFKQGDEVKKDQLIFSIEPRAFEVSLQQAEAILARDVASLQNAEED